MFLTYALTNNYSYVIYHLILVNIYVFYVDMLKTYCFIAHILGWHRAASNGRCLGWAGLGLWNFIFFGLGWLSPKYFEPCWAAHGLLLKSPGPPSIKKIHKFTESRGTPNIFEQLVNFRMKANFCFKGDGLYLLM